MQMSSLPQSPGIEFNPKYFDAAAVDRLIALEVSATVEEVGRLPVVEILESPAFEAGDRQGMYDDAETRKAIEQAIALLKADDEVAQGLADEGEDISADEIREALRTQLLSGTVDQDALNHNLDFLRSIQSETTDDGQVVVHVEGEMLFRIQAKTLQGRKLHNALLIAYVLIDVVAVIAAALGVFLAKGYAFAERVADIFKSVEETVARWATRFLGWVKDVVVKLKALVSGGRNSPEWLQTVKEFAKTIGKAIVASLKFGWNNKRFIQVVKNTVKVLFVGSWASKAFYAAQVVAGIALLIGTGGGSVLIAIIALVSALGWLMWDSYNLYVAVYPE